MSSKEEHLLPHIPYPKLYEPEATSLELIKAVFRSKSAIDRGSAVTPIDLRRTPLQFKNQDILDAVSTHLNIPLGKLEEKPKPGEEEKMYETAMTNINGALTEAKSYIEDVLGLRAPTVEVHSKKDVVDLVRKTTLYRETDRKHLEAHVGYCALISVALAVFELQKEEAHKLEKEMKFLERLLLEPSDTNSHEPLFFKGFVGDTRNGTAVTINGLTKECRAQLSMRDKTRDSQITKYLMKPEANAQEALKDAIGIRLEIKKDRMEDVLVRTLTYFQEHLEATNLKIQDKNMLGDKHLANFRKRKAEEVMGGDNIPVFSDTNPLSADSFQTVNITGTIVVPGANTSAGSPTRQFEIQIVEPENKNEKGLASHVVYELKKHIVVMTRLFGGCSELWLIDRAKKITHNDNARVKNIIEGLQKIKFLIRLPNTHRVYAAASVYRRWMAADGLIVDEPIRAQLMHTLHS